jgi:hypothetical protein
MAKKEDGLKPAVIISVRIARVNAMQSESRRVKRMLEGYVETELKVGQIDGLAYLSEGAKLMVYVRKDLTKAGKKKGEEGK